MTAVAIALPVSERQIEAKLVKRLREQVRSELPDFDFMTPPE